MTSPNQDANDVQIGSKATVLVKAYRDEPISGTVTRTSWALNVKSRTLRAEIDLPNPGQQLLPGMYAYAKVITEHPNTLALPVTALSYSGEKTFCWVYKDGHAQTDRGPDGRQRRAVDRGHQPSATDVPDRR